MNKIRGIGQRIRVFLETSYGHAFKALVLYGSCARGTANKKSDVDFLVVVDDRQDPWEVRESLGDLIWDLLMEEGKLLSVMVVRESFYANYRCPFLVNVRREGVHI